MKTKEELLKIYSSYLPYELKFISYMDVPFDEFAKNPIWTLDGINKMFGDYCLLTKEIPDAYSSATCKPLLYSMDNLTKEIEHKGERFIPLVRLAEIEAGEHNCDETSTEIEDEGYCFSIEYLPSWFTLYFNKNTKMFSRYDDGEGKDSCNTDLRQYLIEWHFNLFDLEDSEYIKKETLKQC